MSQSKTEDIDPELFAEGPARDQRFRVVNRWQDCENLSRDNPLRNMEFLHRQMNEEVDGMECAAANLADFPDASWDIRMKIARQLSDEARHVCMFKNLYEQRGGVVGAYAVMNFQYCIITNFPTLVARLAVQNRLFEAEGVDAIEPAISEARRSGDEQLACLFEAQLADEISHVRYANDYIKALTTESPGKVIEIGRALNQAAIAFRQVMGQHAIDEADYDVNETGRLESGFSEQEVKYAKSLKEDNKKNRPD